MRRLLRLAQIGALMLVAGYATLLLVIAIVQPKPDEALPDSRGSSITASQLQAEAGFLSARQR